MSEEKTEQPSASASAEKPDIAASIDRQEKAVLALEKAAGAEGDDRPDSPELDRERDRLRHLRRLQKGNFKEGAEAKAVYAAKAAARRAVQPVEED